MENLKKIAEQLLKNGDIQVIIGYGEGLKNNVRPIFVRTEAEIQNLIYDERCIQNLAMYIYKKEVLKFGKPAIIANIHTLRGIIRLSAENQIKEGDLITICVNQNDITICEKLNEIEAFLNSNDKELDEKDKELIEKLDAMTLSDRWAFWQKEMEKCIKCYACRQSCPLCYCTQCTVEMNQPQWIPVAASTLGNLEWHIMRAMHLAGRCIECGQCGNACPVNIPIHLLPIKLAEEFRGIYGVKTGMNKNEGCAMSTFKPDDKENFIG